MIFLGYPPHFPIYWTPRSSFLCVRILETSLPDKDSVWLSEMLCLILVGERKFPSSYLYPLPTQPDFWVYFFLSYFPSKTLYIWAHGFPLYIKYKASLAICQGFSENLPLSPLPWENTWFKTVRSLLGWFLRSLINWDWPGRYRWITREDTPHYPRVR